ncbi:hypothetical protein ACFL4T_04210 [candidate division KSB1 bacterium]
MKKIISLICILLLFLTVYPQSKNVIFSDDFESYQDGSDGSPVWNITKGNWIVKDGMFFQKSHEYDCGAMLNIFVDYSFVFEFDVKWINGEPGAGFFFSSRSIENTGFSCMSRFETDQSFMFGKFKLDNYEANTIEKIDTLDKEWHHLTLKVDVKEKKYGIYLDDMPLKADENLPYTAGYIGLQCSGSEFVFDNVKLTGTARDPLSFYWLENFHLTGDEILIPDRFRSEVNIFDIEGKYIKSIGKGVISKPSDVLKIGNKYFVLDWFQCKVHVFENEKWVDSFGYKNLFVEPLKLLYYDGYLFIPDNKLSKIVKYSTDGKSFSNISHPDFSKGEDFFIFNEKLFMLNKEDAKIQVFNFSDWKKEKEIEVDFGDIRKIYVNNKGIYLSVNEEVKLIGFNGRIIKSLKADNFGDIFPQRITGLNGILYIADFLNSRIVCTDYNLFEPDIKVSFSSPNSAEIQWNTFDRENGNLEVYLKEKPVFSKRENNPVKSHEFNITDLKPSTNYHFRIDPLYRSIPTGKRSDRLMNFMTLPKPGKKHFQRINTAVLIFTNVGSKGVSHEDVREMPELSKTEIEILTGQIKDGARFNWVASRMNFDSHLDFFIIEDKKTFDGVFDNSPFYYPLDNKIKKYVKDPEKYESVIYIGCVRKYDKDRKKYVYEGRGGGFTSGYDKAKGYGISWWMATGEDAGSLNNWLFVHEFNHQIDSFFLLSGHPEYWFNHFAPFLGNCARFGEHFDGNAYIMRNVDYHKWYDLKFGELVITDDEDNDGIPDDDESVPLDEKRLSSSPIRKDTDNDGIGDLDEVLFSNWIKEGVADTYPGDIPDLNNKDTDNDNIPDGSDPYPLYPVNPEIRSKTINFDGEIETGEWKEFADIKMDDFIAKAFVNWDNDFLYFGFKMDNRVSFKIQIDADDNGWFLGKDNILVKYKPTANNMWLSDIHILNCSVYKKWPFNDEELGSTLNPEIKELTIGNNVNLEIRIPKNVNLGLNLVDGEKIGLNIGFGVDSRVRFINIFEPNTFFGAVLKRSP